MNRNTEYEKFTQEIYQSLIDAEGKNTIEVKHNVKLQGKSGQSHQIDVYWEYNVAGVKHRVAIECKNYNSTVSIGKVRDFYGVIDDIGNISGIIVTKVGFQKGSVEFAKHYGINLKELREPKDEDWKGIIRSIQLNTTMVLPHIKSRFIAIDQEWVKQNIKLPENGDLSYTLDGMADQIWVIDENSEKIKNFHQLDQELPQNWKAEKDLEHSYHFENGYIAVEKFGKLKISSIDYKYDVNTTTKTSIIKGEDENKVVLKDSISGEKKFIEKNK